MAIDVGVVRPEAMSSYYAQKTKAYSERLRSMGVSLAKFMAFAVFSVEYQHHKATLAYMMRMNATVTERAAAATDGYGPVC